jgi:hypothetical protein
MPAQEPVRHGPGVVGIVQQSAGIAAAAAALTAQNQQQVGPAMLP